MRLTTCASVHQQVYVSTGKQGAAGRESHVTGEITRELLRSLKIMSGGRAAHLFGADDASVLLRLVRRMLEERGRSADEVLCLTIQQALRWALGMLCASRRPCKNLL